MSAPLGQASALLNDNNPYNDSAACGMLDAFINQVNVFISSGAMKSEVSLKWFHWMGPLVREGISYIVSSLDVFNPKVET